LRGPSPRPRRIGLAVVVLANTAHLVAYAEGSDAPWQLAIFVVSLALLPWLCASKGDTAAPPVGLWSPAPRPTWAPRVEVALAGAAMGLGVFLRFWRWDEVPPGIWSDELLAAANGVRILEGHPAPAFGTLPLVPEWPTWVHTFNLYSWYVAGNLQIFGVGHFGIKMLSILPGCATLVAVWWLLRELGGPRIAVIGALLLGFSRWHLTQSRFEWDATLAVAGAVVGLAGMARALRTGRWQWMALGGIAFGMTQYAYLASRLAAVGALGWLLVLLLGCRQAGRRTAVGLLVWALSFGVAAGPVIVFSLTNPQIAEARIEQVRLEEAPEGAGGFRGNLNLYLEMFRERGPTMRRQNVDDWPLLPLGVGELALGGALLGALLWRRGIGHSMTWLVFGAALMGGVFSQSGGTANAHRVGLVVPMLYVWAAHAVDIAVTLLARLAERRPVTGRALAPMFGLLVVFASVFDAHTYFVRFGQSKDLYQGVRAAEHLALAQALEARLSGHEVWVDVHFDDLTLDLLLWRPPSSSNGRPTGGLADPPFTLLPISARRALPAPGGRLPVLLATTRQGRLALAPLYPDVQWEIHTDPWATEIFALGTFPVDVLRRPPAGVPEVAAGGIFFFAEDLEGEGLVRIVLATEKSPQAVAAFVERPDAMDELPKGTLSRFSVPMEWHAMLTAPIAGEYVFAAGPASTRLKVWIDGVRVRLGEGIPLEAGARRLKVRALVSRAEAAVLRWKPPGGSWSELPVEHLRPALPPQWDGAPIP
jgi:hypothetical protein